MTGLDTEPFMARPPLSHQRLDPSSPGIMLAGTTSFQWRSLPAAAVYTFTLFDQHDNVIWSTRTTDTTAQLPADVPALSTRRPYVWTVAGFGESGKPVTNTPWGIITFLTKEDQDALNADVQSLGDQIAANPSDSTPRLLLAQLYREYGVYEGAISTLDDGHLAGQPGLDDLLRDTYAQVSPLALLLYRQSMTPTN
jgi:hypothetical protein